MAHDDRKAIVVGGSLSGLLTSLTLLEHGYHVTVLERLEATQLKDQGAGLRMGDDVAEILAKYGIHEESYAVHPKVLRALDLKGDDIITRPVPGRTTGWGRLHYVLWEAFERCKDAPQSYGGCVKYGCNVVDVVDEGESVRVDYQSYCAVHSLTAKLVIGADGASSKVRQVLLPNIQRAYAGYVVFRSVVPTQDLSPETMETFAEAGVWFWNTDFMTVAYNVPGKAETHRDEDLVANWVWYKNQTEEELSDIMVASDGKRYTFSLPMGKMRPDIVKRIKDLSIHELPPQVTELVQKTENPFIQVVTDMKTSRNSFLNGKVLLIGDAVGGARPHVAAATSQIAFHVERLSRFLQGAITLKQWCEDTMRISSLLCDTSRVLGHICQSTDFRPPEKMHKFIEELMGMYGKIETMWKDAKL